MICKQIFEKHSQEGLDIFMDFFERETNKNMQLIRTIIKKNLKFELQYHKGPIAPEFYTDGIPQQWRCTYCGEPI